MMPFGGQAIKLALGIVSTAILARLLRPQDFGLIAPGNSNHWFNRDVPGPRPIAGNSSAKGGHMADVSEKVAGHLESMEADEIL